MSFPVILGAVGTCVVSAVSGSIELDSNTGKKVTQVKETGCVASFFLSSWDNPIHIKNQGQKPDGLS